ncbi:signal peptide-containing protein [Theileria equi strain WA]|uniref:Signal peptide-containing protein n=1 Tax=Theileria equi strain WA TaxID=1537102 RepID=L0AYC3_THEEQ|nr:signal peptide-containing protein [Theileria equi strain WA]AFZ80258.1 signal peptide-containing protein [Theileria equi strain WA]|eukprot:XP_004829924.1 signal peptide-containing protein [Theileria equi strain WA]
MRAFSTFCVLFTFALQRLVSADDGYGTRIFTVCSKACGESVSSERHDDLLECQNECQTNLVNLLLKKNGDMLRGSELLKKKHGIIRRATSKVLKPVRTVLGIRKRRNKEQDS